jgi:hypothetical protein
MPSAKHAPAAVLFRHPQPLAPGRGRLWPVPLLLLLLCYPTAAPARDAEPAPWRYVTPAAGEGMEHPPFYPTPLTGERPDDLSMAVPDRGARRRYAQFRYGSPDSARVAVVLDEIGPGAFDLYVDRNRDRRIEPGELVPGTGVIRRVTLPVEIVQKGTVQHSPRSLLLRRGVTGKTLGLATLGYLEGEAGLDGRRVKVRRVDGDSNGLFADLRDRLWIDRNGDGQWDPIAEQFPHLPVLRLGEGRFAVRADAVGNRLAFEPVVGVGRLKLHLPSLAKTARVRHLQVMMMGEDGSAFTLQGGDEPATLPVGRYAPGSVALSVLDGTAPEPWNFVFSRSGGDAPRRWYEVRADREVTVDPLGQLRFELHLPAGGARPGQELSVSPRLFTADGLLINSSACGDVEPFASSDKHNCATVQLVSSAGIVLGSAQSGFA